MFRYTNFSFGDSHKNVTNATSMGNVTNSNQTVNDAGNKTINPIGHRSLIQNSEIFKNNYQSVLDTNVFNQNFKDNSQNTRYLTHETPVTAPSDTKPKIAVATNSIEVEDSNIVNFSTNEILLFSAVISATDTVAALTFISESDESKLFSILFGEGVINDAVCIVLYKIIRDFTAEEKGIYINITLLYILLNSKFPIKYRIYFNYSIRYVRLIFKSLPTVTARWSISRNCLYNIF